MAIKKAAVKDHKGNIFSKSPTSSHKDILEMMDKKGVGTGLMVRGFLDDKNKFVRRKTAMKIAKQAGQVDRQGTDLHSHDL